MLLQHVGYTDANKSRLLVQHLENVGPTCSARFPWPLNVILFSILFTYTFKDSQSHIFQDIFKIILSI